MRAVSLCPFHPEFPEYIYHSHIVVDEITRLEAGQSRVDNTTGTVILRQQKVPLMLHPFASVMNLGFVA